MRSRYNSVIIISVQMVVERMMKQSRRGYPVQVMGVHLAAGREGSCDNVLCLGINNTVSGFLGGGGFGF